MRPVLQQHFPCVAVHLHVLWISHTDFSFKVGRKWCFIIIIINVLFCDFNVCGLFQHPVATSPNLMHIFGTLLFWRIRQPWNSWDQQRVKTAKKVEGDSTCEVPSWSPTAVCSNAAMQHLLHPTRKCCFPTLSIRIVQKNYTANCQWPWWRSAAWTDELLICHINKKLNSLWRRSLVSKCLSAGLHKQTQGRFSRTSVEGAWVKNRSIWHGRKTRILFEMWLRSELNRATS